MKIACIGDSTTEGIVGDGTFTGLFASSYPSRLNQLMNVIYGSRIDSTWGDQGLINQGQNLTTYALYDPRLSFGAGWSQSGITANIGGGSLSNSTNANNYAFTPVKAFDTIDIYYAQYSGANTFNVNVDGGASIGGPYSTNGTQTIAKITVSCAYATHTVNIQRAAGTIYIIGIHCYVSTFSNAAPEVQIAQFGYGGANISQLVTNSNGNWTGPLTLAAYAPDLTIICMDINDAIAITNVNTYKTNYQSLITAALLSGDCIIMNSLPKSTDATTYASYRLAELQLSQTNSVLNLNMISNFSNYTQANALGYIGADGIHPTAKGYGYVAKIIYNLLAAN